MKYSDYTRNTKETFKKVAHGTRFEKALKLVPLTKDMKVLDYGCGDGGFFYNLEEKVPAYNLYGFDPAFLNEMDFEGATTYDDVNILLANHGGSFDVIYCMEVCEHLDDKLLYELLSNIRALSHKETIVVFGVPIETGFSGFFKNIYRVIKGGRQGATIGIAFQSLFGIAIDRVASPIGWMGSHIGFDIKNFKRRLDYGGYMEIDAGYLPWPALGKLFNNEKYFICKRNKRHGNQ